MERTLRLDVVTPERLLISAEVNEAVVPGIEGEFGVRPGHANFLSALRTGELRFRSGAVWNHLAIVGGYAEVTPTRATVLADTAELAEEIDLARAEAAAKAAEQVLAEPTTHAEREQARQRMERALLRLRVGRKRRV